MIWDLTDIPQLTEQQHLDFKVGPDFGDVIAIGGNLSLGLLLSAYRQGIFPWYNEGQDIHWWSPRQRFVLFPESLHISKSLRRSLRKESHFEFSLDRAFDQVVSACASLRQTSWITPEMRAAYSEMHARGYAHSVECWEQSKPHAEPKLVGGLYGVCLGRCFFGESMFSLVPNASKMAFALFVLFFKEKGLRLIDCQQESAHLASFGAELILREEFHLALLNLEEKEPWQGSWAELWPEFGAV